MTLVGNRKVVWEGRSARGRLYPDGNDQVDIHEAGFGTSVFGFVVGSF